MNLEHIYSNNKKNKSIRNFSQDYKQFCPLANKTKKNTYKYFNYTLFSHNLYRKNKIDEDREKNIYKFIPSITVQHCQKTNNKFYYKNYFLQKKDLLSQKQPILHTKKEELKEISKSINNKKNFYLTGFSNNRTLNFYKKKNGEINPNDMKKFSLVLISLKNKNKNKFYFGRNSNYYYTQERKKKIIRPRTALTGGDIATNRKIDNSLFNDLYLYNDNDNDIDDAKTQELIDKARNETKKLMAEKPKINKALVDFEGRILHNNLLIELFYKSRKFKKPKSCINEKQTKRNNLK